MGSRIECCTPSSAEAQKEEGTGSRIATFVCMTKIHHWGVGVTKLRDEVVENVCDDSYTANEEPVALPANE